VLWIKNCTLFSTDVLFESIIFKQHI
jgi:hypothetical protein